MQKSLDSTVYSIYKHVQPFNKTKDDSVLRKLVENFSKAYHDSIYNRSSGENYSFTQDDIDSICDMIKVVLRKS